MAADEIAAARVQRATAAFSGACRATAARRGFTARSTSGAGRGSCPARWCARAARRRCRLALELDVLDPQMQRRFAARFAAAPPPPPLPGTIVARLAAMAAAQCINAAMLAPLRPELQLVTLTALVGRRDGTRPGLRHRCHARGARRAMPASRCCRWKRPSCRPMRCCCRRQRSRRSSTGPWTDLENGRTRAFVGRLADIWSDCAAGRAGALRRMVRMSRHDDARALHKRLLDDAQPGAGRAHRCAAPRRASAFSLRSVRCT